MDRQDSSLATLHRICQWPAARANVLWDVKELDSKDLEAFLQKVLQFQDETTALSAGPAETFTNDINEAWLEIRWRIYYMLLCKSTTPALPSLTRHYEHLPDQVTCRDPDSDVDEKDDLFFDEVRHALNAFHNDPARSFYVIRPLPAVQRRHIHAVAHFMHFGHLSIGTGRLRMLLLSKKSHDLSAERKSRYKAGRRIPDAQRGPSPARAAMAYQQAPPKLNNNWLYNENLYEDPQSIPGTANEGYNAGFNAGYSSAGSSASASSHLSGSSIGSSTSRRRQRRTIHGFQCKTEGCGAAFDRSCDLVHHQRIHIPYEERPYPCGRCQQRFLYPKDLRRHEKKHGPELL